MKYKIYFTILSRNYITIFLQKFSKKKENKFSSFKITNLKLYKTFYSRSYRIFPPLQCVPMRRQLLLFFARRLPSHFSRAPPPLFPPSPPPAETSRRCLTIFVMHTVPTHVHAFYETLKGQFFSLPHSWSPLVDNPFSPVFRHFFLETGSLHKAPWHCVEAGFNQGLTCTRDVYSAEYRGRIIKCINSRVFFEPSFFFSLSLSCHFFFSFLPPRPFLLLASDRSQSLGGARASRNSS